MKSMKELTLTKKGKFYTKVCKVYGMVMKAKKEFAEISKIFEKNGYDVYEKEVCEHMLMQLALFSDNEYLKFLHMAHEISTEKIEENNKRIQEIHDYIDKKTSNSEIF